MNPYPQLFLSFIIGISGAVITSFINFKNAKSPNKERIATELLENFFAPNSNTIELKLYKPLNSEIKNDLINLKNKYQKQLVYFSSDFATQLRNITSCPDKKLSDMQSNYELFSKIYLRTLNETRSTLGLPKLSIQFRLDNDLFRNTKSAKRLKISGSILLYTLIFSLIPLILTIFMMERTYDTYPQIQSYLLIIFKISFTTFALDGMLYYFYNDFFKF